ncbi:MAG: prephenate dehydrogenase/arogenate dehydrogenase family protein [Thermoanaerobaculales bacterium]|jgi:prephenate dehydrogenase/chorismate mutase|nr:prephenate dehydrogenase/arogenate dehydrogenase family protein [Thermoanaerobaculales bacterium]
MHAPRTHVTDPHALLEQHRRDIEALDRRILHLVCERLELARQIGDLKRELAVPLRNFGVESQVHRRFEDASALLGLDPSLGRDLARFLIEKAVEEQATLRDAVYAGNALDTVVVGGKGGMGRWMARFLAGQGHRVRVVDPAPGETPFEEVGSLGATAAADLVMVAVPMSACGGVLEELAAAAPRGVVAEMCSLKGHLARVLDGVRSRGVRVVSFHPMFGPAVRMLEGRTVAFCTDAPRADLEVVQGLFADTSARLVEMDPAEHDRRMGLVLGLTHLANLVFARAVVRSGVGAAELAEVAGVTFGRQMATTREVVAENPSLYYEIQALNGLTPDTGRWLREALDEWLGAVATPDHHRFAELMASCREALGGHPVEGGR